MTDQVTSDSSLAFIRWFRVMALLAVIAFVGYVVYYNATAPDSQRPFELGLDLAGGSHLVYEADTSSVDPSEVPELMNVLRDVIERRVNVLGVSEPIVQVERSSFVSEGSGERLVVELPGVTDVDAAVAEIGRTPLLEFKLVDEELLAQQETLRSLEASIATTSSTTEAVLRGLGMVGDEADPFIPTGLTGRYLESAALEFAGQMSGQLSNEPIVTVRFNSEGAALFAEITRNNVNRQLGIFLDGELLSAPNINEPIAGGTAMISGGFTPDEARDLAQNLNFGALPVPISLASVQTIDATLGVGVINMGVLAAIVGLAAITFFMIVWYRLPGLVAGAALAMYVILTLAVFMYLPVTLTAAGLAGFILSLGMAVDANVLVFERMKEEFRSGKGSREAAEIGFTRAWSAIRDGNVTSLLSALILFWFGTSMIKGFALVLGVGIIISMLTALTLTRTLLTVFPDVRRSDEGVWPMLLGSGFVRK